MPNQGVCLVLGQHTDFADAGIDAIGQREVDDAEFTPEEHSRLCTPPRQFMQARTAPSCQDQGQGIPGQPGYLSGVGYLHLISGVWLSIRVLSGMGSCHYRTRLSCRPLYLPAFIKDGRRDRKCCGNGDIYWEPVRSRKPRQAQTTGGHRQRPGRGQRSERDSIKQLSRSAHGGDHPGKRRILQQETADLHDQNDSDQQGWR